MPEWRNGAVQESRWREEGKDVGFGKAAIGGQAAVGGEAVGHKILVRVEVDEKAEVGRRESGKAEEG